MLVSLTLKLIPVRTLKLTADGYTAAVCGNFVYIDGVIFRTI
jgi:hypothetical protein